MDADIDNQLLLLRHLIEKHLPSCIRLEEVSITIGKLHEEQEPAFKAIVRISKIRDEEEPGGWGYELTTAIRKFWSRDDLYVSIEQLADEPAPE